MRWFFAKKKGEVGTKSLLWVAAIYKEAIDANELEGVNHGKPQIQNQGE
jgi:hypothetical protein